MNLRTYVGVVALVIAVVAGGCAPQQSPGSTQGTGERVSAPKRVIAAIHGDAMSVYTRLVAGSAGAASGGQVLGSRILGPMVGSGLSTKDLTGATRPLLAEANPSLENGLWKIAPDGRMETSWKIRDGAVWHDGTPITADDLVFTTRVERDREMPWALPPQYRYVQEIEAADPRTLTVRWNQTYIQADEFLQDQPLPRHILEAPYLDNKVTFLEMPYWNADYVGTGPFKVKQFALNSHVILAAHDRYVLGRPGLDEVEVRFINDGNTLLANLLAGTVELVLDRSVSLDLGMQVRDRWTAGQMGVGYAGWVNMYIQFLNPDPPIMSDVRYRRALIHAVDRQQIVDTLQFGLSSVPHSLYGPHNIEYPAIESRIVKYDYDPRRAAQMISDLGYTRGADGMFRDGSGEKLVAHLWALAGDDANVKPLLAVADYWKQIGVTPEVNLVSEQAANDSVLRANFPGFSVQGGADGQSGIPRLHSREARVAETNYRGSNYMRYRNADLDALVDRYFATIPFDERVQVLGQIVNHTTDVLTNVGLFWRMAPSFIPNRLVNVEGANNLGNQAWNAHLWEVR